MYSISGDRVVAGKDEIDLDDGDQFPEYVVRVVKKITFVVFNDATTEALLKRALAAP